MRLLFYGCLTTELILFFELGTQNNPDVINSQEKKQRNKSWELQK